MTAAVAVSSNLFDSVVSVTETDITRLYDKATHVDVRTYRAGTRPIHSDLAGIVILGARYDDTVAACACADIELFKFGDEGYTRCARHGVLCIGFLRRQIVNGRKHG